MEALPQNLFDAISAYFHFFFSDILSILTFLGLILWLLGGGTLGLYLWIKNSGYLTDGKILGFVTKRRLKTKKDGSTEEKTSQYLVLECQDDAGHQKRGLSSDWEPKYARFAQGQAVTLRIISNPAYDDVYIAHQQGALKLAIGFWVAGFLCFARYWQSPALWVSGVVIALVSCMLVITFFRRVAPPTEVPPEKQFSENDIQPMNQG